MKKRKYLEIFSNGSCLMSIKANKTNQNQITFYNKDYNNADYKNLKSITIKSSFVDDSKYKTVN